LIAIDKFGEEIMKESVLDDITRVIGNRMFELHPLQRASVGMESFSLIIPLVQSLSKAELREHVLPLMDKLLLQQSGCISCHAKGLVFAKLFCEATDEESAVKYTDAYEKYIAMWQSHQMKVRDFRSEVYKAIKLYESEISGKALN